MVQIITSTSEFNSVLESSGDSLIVVDFFATWCGPCKMIAPLLDKFSTEYSQVKFLKVDVDQLGDIAQKYSITSMPTLVFIKNGQEIERVIGANPAAIKGTISKLA
ncbi:TRX2 Thioredoxin-2 [Candida maltosa Xu316]|uniref:Thioredoxin n=1 Tax=Candida maltosa (strain Xu316) TaxID=1245528 RepID=M3IRQ5_CANMX|nr:Thioredoxin II [Candida maltosa Xu316]